MIQRIVVSWPVADLGDRGRIRTCPETAAIPHGVCPPFLYDSLTLGGHGGQERAGILLRSMAARHLVAKCNDSLALKINEVANAHKVPLVENRPLAQALYSGVELDAEIPPEHNPAVAQVIAHIKKLRRTGPRP